MKKLLTLVAFMASFMGANAANWVEVYKIDYSQNTGFPFYVMGYVPEWIDGVMTDYGSNYRYETQENLDGDGDSKWKDGESSEGTVKNQGGTEYQKVTGAGPYWHQYFICDNIPTQIDGHYKAVAVVRASEPVTINVNMGWGWGNGQQKGNDQVAIGTEWAEVEWEYSEIDGSSCNLVAQPGTSAATIEWKSVIVYEDQTNQRPVSWQEWLTSDGKPVVVETTPAAIPTWMGNAETPWADPNVRFNDKENNYLICAWGKEKGVNMNEENGWDPFPATIEEEEGNHYFIVHGKEATTEGDASSWDNQFWVESPKAWKAGEQVKISFRYKASKNVTTGTQIHHQNPSDYMTWQGVGDVSFTTEWQTFEKVYSWPSDGSRDDDTGWSLCFNLNSTDKEAIDFYFDDLSWQSMVLDEGLFVASSNTKTGLEYDFSNAVDFEYNDDAAAFAATVGTAGDKDSWVNEIMISTVRGNDAAFKSNTIKPSGSYIGFDDFGDENWGEYTEASLAKIKLPAAGVWDIYVDTDNKQIHIEKVEGEEEVVVVINPNPSELVIHTLERQYTEAEGADVEGLPENIGTDENPWGQPWDNQFWIVANRVLTAGEATIVKFKYKSTIDAKASTQSHHNPGQYIHWAAIGDVNFVGGDEWQDFEKTFTIPAECTGTDPEDTKSFLSIAFNLAEIKSANDYYIKDVIWMTEDGTESLINQTGTENFYYKVVGGPVLQYGQSAETKKGDVNGDGAVNVADISAIISVMAGTASYDNADVNDDGAVNVADISNVISIMAGTNE